MAVTSPPEPFNRERLGVSNIATLEPYEPSNEWIQVNRCKQRLKKRDERHIRKLIKFDSIFQEKPYFVKMFTIRFPGVDINEQLNILQADEDIKGKVGKLKKIVKASKNTLLVKTENEMQ